MYPKHFGVLYCCCSHYLGRDVFLASRSKKVGYKPRLSWSPRSSEERMPIPEQYTLRNTCMCDVILTFKICRFLLNTSKLPYCFLTHPQ